jgi:hypothetical protein
MVCYAIGQRCGTRGRLFTGLALLGEGLRLNERTECSSPHPETKSRPALSFLRESNNDRGEVDYSQESSVMESARDGFPSHNYLAFTRFARILIHEQTSRYRLCSHRKLYQKVCFLVYLHLSRSSGVIMFRFPLTSIQLDRSSKTPFLSAPGRSLSCSKFLNARTP